MFIILLNFSCAHWHTSNQELNEELVSLDAALNQAQASYLKGCVDGQKKLKVPLAFHGCRDMSIIHRKEIETFFQQPIEK